MTIDQLNTALAELYTERTREKMIDTARLLVEWMALEWPEEGRERLLTPTKENLKKFLVRHPRTNQPQFYRLTAKNQPVEIRLAVIKKIRKDQLRQLIDKETRLDFQLSPPAIQAMPSAPAYSFHLTCTPEFDGLYLILHQGDHKRVMALRRKLTQTQFQKIVPEWRGIGKKTKPEIAAQLWKSLDLKEVNKDFYKLIKEKYDDLIGLAAAQQPALNPEAVKQFAVRLIGRYIFCWFLKEKGVIPEPLLGSASIRERRGRFTRDYLLRLFFNTLNAEVADPVRHSTSNDLDAHYTHIPYLNGGLFDRQEEDALFDQLVLDEWLMGFVEVLERFDFTVDESSSQYQLVAIDPEMLGRIFENLLATQNKDTEKAANQRKAFGAFYTPREIVDYMVNESLKAWVESRVLPVIPDEGENAVAEPLVEYKGTLFEAHEPRQTLLNLDAKEIAHRETLRMQRTRMKERIDKLFAPDCPENPFEKEELNAVRKALSEVTVLDPACGSGAFPMGVLLRLMELRQIVGHGHRSSYDLKNEILSKSIYGVDIMPMAVEIARLRAWLSLVLEAEYKPADKKNNFGIAALPNLDFKFVCANSLISMQANEVQDLVKEGAHISSTVRALNDKLNELHTIRRDYFNPQGDQFVKRKLREQFYEVRSDIISLFKSTSEQWNLKGLLPQVESWDPFNDNKRALFFSPEWMFGITDGFDVVIGNPPYAPINAGFRNELKGQYKLQEGKPDLYRYFTERSLQLMTKKGILYFIIPNSILTIPSAQKLRKSILSNYAIREIVNFDEMVFDSVSMNNIVIGIEKYKPLHKVKICVLIKNSLVSGVSETKEVPQNEFLKNTREEIGIFKESKTDELIESIHTDSIRLANTDGIEITLGIQAYHNSLHSEEEIKSKFLHSSTKQDDTYLPEIGGRNITHYKMKLAATKFIRICNLIYNKPEDKFFHGTRIIVREITGDRLICAITTESNAVNKSCYIILNNETVVTNLTLLAYLTSELVAYIVRTTGDKAKQSLFPRISMHRLKSLPLPIALLDKRKQNQIDKLMQNLLECSNPNEVTKIRAEIDYLINNIYNIQL